MKFAFCQQMIVGTLQFQALKFFPGGAKSLQEIFKKFFVPLVFIQKLS